MAKTASQIVDRALTLIDEVPTSFNTAATTETSIREQALQILPEVCRDLVKELPWGLKQYLGNDGVELINNLEIPIGENQTDYIKQKVIFTAPDDFWELISLQLDVWAKPVTKYIYVDSTEYSKQNNPFTRASKQNPVVAMSQGIQEQSEFPKDKMKLECFSVTKGDVKTVAEFQYISFDNVPDNVDNTWPDELFDEVTKALAAQLHIIKSRIDEAVIKGEETKSAIGQHE